MRVLALLIGLFLLLAPAAAAGAATSTATTPLSLTAPSFMTRPSSTTPTPSRTPGEAGQLPYTGDDLWPEAVAAVGLVAAGAGIRLRLHLRRR